MLTVTVIYFTHVNSSILWLTEYYLTIHCHLDSMGKVQSKTNMTDFWGGEEILAVINFIAVVCRERNSNQK